MEHRDRLIQPPVAVLIGDELVCEIAEVLLVDAVVRVEVRDDDLRGIEAEARELAIQPSAAVSHRARLADDHTRLEWIQDVEEVAELRPEDVAQLGHVLAALEVRLAGDDGHHPHVARVVRVGQGLDGLIELLVWLGVCRDEGDVPDLARIRERLAQADKPREAALLVHQPVQLAPPAVCSRLVSGGIEFRDPDADALDQTRKLVMSALRIREREGSLAPIDRDDAADARERDGDADRQDDRPVHPVEVEADHEHAKNRRPANGQRNH